MSPMATVVISMFLKIEGQTTPSFMAFPTAASP